MNPTTLQPYPNPTKDQQQLATLSYLCAANGHVLPPAVTFPWNWVATQLSNNDGAIAINRNTSANYFRNQLASYVPKNCILPSIGISLSGFDTNVSFSWKLTPLQSPTVTTPSSGQTVLSFDYSKFGLNGVLDALRLTSTYNLTVEFVSKTIVIHNTLFSICWPAHSRRLGRATLLTRRSSTRTLLELTRVANSWCLTQRQC